MSKESNSTSGISFFTVLFIVFLILKLTHTIDWSWWWVTAPLWGGVAAVILVLVLIVMISVIFKR